MKKLSKKINSKKNTLEAYSSCGCNCFCYGKCTKNSAPSATMTAVNRMQNNSQSMFILSI